MFYILVRVCRVLVYEGETVTVRECKREIKDKRRRKMKKRNVSFKGKERGALR